jgi:hypothetical protein
VAIDLTDVTVRSFQLTTAAGAAVDADSTPVYTVTLPTLAAGIAPAVQHGVTGDYYVLYPVTMSGLHTETLTAVIGGQTVVIRRVFNVESTNMGFVDTDEAILFLKGAGIVVSAADLEWLRWLCAVASAAVAGDLGRTITPTAVTTTVDGGSGLILLHTSPIISITSISENGVTLAGTDYVADLTAGILYRGTQQAAKSWGTGRQNITISMVAGYQTPPRVARQVALTIVQRQWSSTRQMPHPAMDDVGAALEQLAGTGRSPSEVYRAYEKLRAGGFA